MKIPIDLTKAGRLEGRRRSERYLASALARARKLTELAEIPEGDRVLDVACGTGIVTRMPQKAGAASAIVGSISTRR
jgi:2-polyprenyl-3-methyl-5-hydroxy-6-metoxy-1,4-benzoquinol methylase